MITLVMELQLEKVWRSLVVLGQTRMVKFSNVNLMENKQGKEGKQFFVKRFLVSLASKLAKIKLEEVSFFPS